MEFLLIFVCWYICVQKQNKTKHIYASLLMEGVMSKFCMYIVLISWEPFWLTPTAGIRFLGKLRALLGIWYLSNNGTLEKNIIPVQMSSDSLLLRDNLSVI